MSKSEIVKVITAIKVQCPDALQYHSDKEFDLLIEMWYATFNKYPNELVWEAARKALLVNDYQRKNWLAAINTELEKMITALENSDNELWHSLLSAIKEVKYCINYASFGNYDKDTNTIYRLSDEGRQIELNRIFENLNDYLKSYLHDVDYLITLSRYNDTELSIEKSRFMKLLPDIRNRQKILQAMPQEVKLLISDTANNLRLLQLEKR